MQFDLVSLYLGDFVWLMFQVGVLFRVCLTNVPGWCNVPGLFG